MSPLSPAALRDLVSDVVEAWNVPHAAMGISAHLMPSVLRQGLPWPPGVEPVWMWPTRDLDFVVLMRGAGLPGDGLAVSMIVRRDPVGLLFFDRWDVCPT